MGRGIFIMSDIHRRRQGWEHRERSPEIEKLRRKMMLFPRALFLATIFPKIANNSIFLLNFHQTCSKFLTNFLTNCVFRPYARNSNSGFVNFEKIG